MSYRIVASEDGPLNRAGCQEQVCWCHDDTASLPPNFFCSGCGCRAWLKEDSKIATATVKRPAPAIEFGINAWGTRVRGRTVTLFQGMVGNVRRHGGGDICIFTVVKSGAEYLINLDELEFGVVIV